LLSVKSGASGEEPRFVQEGLVDGRLPPMGALWPPAIPTVRVNLEESPDDRVAAKLD